MPIFDNPNNLQQPKAGVYRWYIDSTNITLYIGRSSGATKSAYKKASTLFRGIAEASMNHSKAVNTNVLVGQAIEYVEKKGYVCHWKHICDDPSDEKNLVCKYKPIIQEPEKTKIFSRDINEIQKEIDRNI